MMGTEYLDKTGKPWPYVTRILATPDDKLKPWERKVRDAVRALGVE
jgi:hypothetical protein